MNSNQAEREDASHDGKRDEHVQRSNLVGDEVWQYPTKGRQGVQDGEQVESQILVGEMRADGEVLDVEERHVDAHEADEAADDKGDPRQLPQRAPVDELARRRGQDSHPHDGYGDEERGELDEADDARGPAEADSGLQLVEDDRIDDAAWMSRQR